MLAPKKLFKSNQLKKLVIICLAGFCILPGSMVFAAASAESARPVKLSNSVFKLRHIDAEAAKIFLSKLQIGENMNTIKGINALVVTAVPKDLNKAHSITKLIDSEKKFAVETILSDVTDWDPATIEAISELLKDMSIGTFVDSPANEKNAAIVDVHNEALIVIADSDNIDRVVSATKQALAGPEEIAEANDIAPAEVEPEAEETAEEKLFKELVEAVKAAETDAEKQAAMQKIAEAEAATAAEANAPDLTAVEPDVPVEPNITVAVVEPAEIIEAEKDVEVELQIPEATAELELDLPEKVEIVKLIELLGVYLNVDYMYDPAKVRGTVTLVVQDKIKVKELYEIVEHAMKFRGFIMTRKGNLVTIVPAGEALNIGPEIQDDAEKIMAGNVIISRVFRLKSLTPTRARTMLAEMKLGTTINAVNETNSLIVTAYAYRMKRIEKLLKMIDVPGEEKIFKYRKLKYTMAENMKPKLETLTKQLEAVSAGVTAPVAPPPPGRPARGAAARRPTRPTTVTPGQKKAGIYLDIDERTNRILMIGTEAEIALVEGLIDTFDIPQQDLRQIQEYKIYNVDAEEIINTLNTLGIMQTGPARRGRGRITQQPRPGAKKPATTSTAGGPLVDEPMIAVLELTNSLLVNATAEQHAMVQMVIAYVDRKPDETSVPFVVYHLESQKPEELAPILNELVQKTIQDKQGKVTSATPRLEDDVVIVPDEKTRAIVVYASKKNQEWIGSLIETLDRRRPEVLLDVALVEITETDKFEYDLKIAANAEKYVADNIKLTPLSTTAVGTVLESGFNISNPGEFQGFFSHDKVQALLTAIQSKNYGRILAKPKIFVTDNEEGSIVTTDQTYYSETTTRFDDNNNQIDSTSFKGVDARIELKITPHISEGDLLKLEINMVREDFIIVEGRPGPPDKASSTLDTKVTIPDNKTVILGGLVKLNQTKGGSKIPILGDLPLIGGAFRTVGNNDRSSKLYIFVRANIVRPNPEQTSYPELEAVSQRNREEFEQAEEEFQKHKTIPGIKEQPVEPTKVLGEIY